MLILVTEQASHCVLLERSSNHICCTSNSSFQALTFEEIIVFFFSLRFILWRLKTFYPLCWISFQIKILHDQSVDYLKCPPRNLRSMSRSLISCQTVKTDSFGGRTFSVAASKLWNSISEDIKKAKTVDCFKTKLKTFLFK